MPISLGSTELFSRFLNLTGSQREAVIKAALEEESVPEWWWNFKPVEVQENDHKLVYFVSPDYICLGNDMDWMWCPMTPLTCKEWMGRHDLVLPTTKMMQAIWEQAPIKGEYPISYSRIYSKSDRKPNRDSTAVYLSHGSAIKSQLDKKYPGWTPGIELVAGHKKDVVLANRLSIPEKKGKVAIVGWQNGQTGEYAQPFTTIHSVSYIDYSTCCRAIKNQCLLDGVPTTMKQIWSNPLTATLVNDSVLLFQSY